MLDEDGNLKAGTTPKEFVFSEVVSSKVSAPPTAVHSVSGEELADFHRKNLERRAVELRKAKEEWEARAYAEDGSLRLTEVEAFHVSERVMTPQRPKTEFEWDTTSKTQLAKANASTRDEARAILQKEAEAFQRRMEARAKREGKPSPFARSNSAPLERRDTPAWNRKVTGNGASLESRKNGKTLLKAPEVSPSKAEPIGEEGEYGEEEDEEGEEGYGEEEEGEEEEYEEEEEEDEEGAE